MACKEIIESLKKIKGEAELWSLTVAEKDELNALIFDFTFLDIFLRLQSYIGNRNLLIVSQEIQDKLPSVGLLLHRLFSRTVHILMLQELIRVYKLKIRDGYSYTEGINLLGEFSEPKAVHKFFQDVMENVSDVLKADDLGIDPLLRVQIDCGLSMLNSFCFLLIRYKAYVSGNVESTESSLIAFFNHAIPVAAHTAMIIFLHLPDDTRITSLLDDLVLKKIMPFEPSVRHIYVQVLPSIQSGQSFATGPSCIEVAFSSFLELNLALLGLYNYNGFLVPVIDKIQLTTLSQMFGFLKTILSDMPPKLLGSLHTEMHSVMVSVAISVFSSYEHKQDVVSQEVDTLGFPHLIPQIGSLICRVNRAFFQSTLPRIDGLGFVDFLLENLKELLTHSADSQSPAIKNLLEVAMMELELVQPFLTEQSIEHDRLKVLAVEMIGKVYEVEYIVDCYTNKDIPDWCLTPWLSDLIEEIGFVNTEVKKIKGRDSPPTDIITGGSNVLASSQFERIPSVTNEMVGFEDVMLILRNELVGGPSQLEEIEFVKTEVETTKEVKGCDSPPTDNITDVSDVLASSVTNEMVGFEDVILTLRNQLVGGTSQLDVISILGQYGQGKTTVAQKLFTDESVVSLFDACAKYLFPVRYEHRELLVAILRDVVDKPTDLSEVPEDELVGKLYKLLLPKRYLVLIDNVDDPVAWDYLKSCFPNANNGSRILLTTRSDNVAYKARRVSSPHHLRSFSPDECLMLLQKKAFLQRSLPPYLMPFVQKLARDQWKICGGWPYYVVLVAGVLTKMTVKEVELMAEGDDSVNVVFSNEVNKKFREYLLKQLPRSPLENTNNTFEGCTASPLACTAADDMVGFHDVMETLTNRLVKRTPTDLDVISIVGMAGKGKTTLANKLFLDESIVSRFDIRAKCTVSQVYERRELLVVILSDLVDDPADLSEMPEAELAVKLRRLLLRKRYLILIDDVWDSRAWDDLRSCFPDDNTGSRILLTTRQVEVAEYARCFSPPYHLRLLSDKESWILLQKRVFLRESCPLDLIDVGQEIVNKCGRLPLSIVLIAGVLTRTMKKEHWKQVAENFGPHIYTDSKHIIELSYKSLPHYLRPCFLYFGAFLEDKEIQIPKLMNLWVAEGLVVKQDERCSVDTAESHLKELIQRNMVMITKKGSLGKVKSCSIHDMLLEFCKEKAKEERFLTWIYRDGDAVSPKMLSQMRVKRRISIYSKQHNLVGESLSCSNVHTVLFRKVGDDVVPSDGVHVSFSIRNFKCLRVLDLEFVAVDAFPVELIQLRYLALRTVDESIPPSIANLRNLQTLVVKGIGRELLLPHSLSKMVKQRHLQINDRASFDLQNLKEFIEDPSELEILETFSTLSLSFGEDAESVLRKTPNLQKLRCIFSGSSGERKKECNQFPRLQHLTKLESLNMSCSHCPERLPCQFSFPMYLKKLTLSGFRFPWSEVSSLSTLSNLAVLKLKSDAFYGEEWEVSDEQFSQLKVLKLENMSFEQWSISDDAFSNLEQLVLHRCDCLVEIPSDFGYLNSLKSIKVKSCQESVINSARDVEEIQVEEIHNNFFKLFIS